jgi:hypothetical protein
MVFATKKEQTVHSIGLNLVPWCLGALVAIPVLCDGAKLTENGA